ncbi:hypothetical protein KKH18_07920, partial [bacterium]|nr:hypothetical protein [bacterium]
MPAIIQAFGHDSGMSHGGHKVGIPAPAGDDVIMEMILNAGTGGPSEIHADIEAVRGEALGENTLGKGQRPSEVGMF